MLQYFSQTLFATKRSLCILRHYKELSLSGPRNLSITTRQQAVPIHHAYACSEFGEQKIWAPVAIKGVPNSELSEKEKAPAAFVTKRPWIGDDLGLPRAETLARPHNDGTTRSCQPHIDHATRSP